MKPTIEVPVELFMELAEIAQHGRIVIHENNKVVVFKSPSLIGKIEKLIEEHKANYQGVPKTIVCEKCGFTARNILYGKNVIHDCDAVIDKEAQRLSAIAYKASEDVDCYTTSWDNQTQKRIWRAVAKAALSK